MKHWAVTGTARRSRSAPMTTSSSVTTGPCRGKITLLEFANGTSSWEKRGYENFLPPRPAGRARRGGAGVGLWTTFFPRPEKIVRKRLAQVAAEASFNSGENPLVIAARAEHLASRFSTNVEVNLNAPGLDRKSTRLNSS